MADSGGNSFVVHPFTATDDENKEFQSVTVTWKIKKYALRARGITSPEFRIATTRWELSVFPYGESRTGAIGEVAIFLKKKFSLKHELTVSSGIIVLSAERHYNSKIIKQTFKGDGSSFRYPNTWPKDFGHLPDNTFTITCNVFVIAKERAKVPPVQIAKKVQENYCVSSPDPHKGQGSKQVQTQCIEKGPSLLSRERNCASKVHALTCDAPRPTKQVAPQVSQKKHFVADLLDLGRPLEGRKSTSEVLLVTPRNKKPRSLDHSSEFEERYNNPQFTDVTLKSGTTSVSNEVAQRPGTSTNTGTTSVLNEAAQKRGTPTNTGTTSASNEAAQRRGTSTNIDEFQAALRHAENQGWLRRRISDYHRAVSLSKDFESLYSNPRFADVTLRLGKVDFLAHKVVLRSRSKVFEAMFEHDMQENRQNTVDLIDMEVDTVKDLLRYIYCGKMREISFEETINLYIAADRYGLEELVSTCRNILLDELSLDNFLEVSATADLHSDQLLLEAIKSLLSKDLKKVLKSERWKTFAKENPVLSLNLVESVILNE